MLIRRISGTESAQTAHHARGFGGIVRPMQPSDQHKLAETRFRELITSAGLDQPDGVDYEPDSLVFRWSGPKVAVVVDLEPSARRPAEPPAADVGHPEDDRLIPYDGHRDDHRRPTDGSRRAASCSRRCPSRRCCSRRCRRDLRGPVREPARRARGRGCRWRARVSVRTLPALRDAGVEVLVLRRAATRWTRWSSASACSSCGRSATATGCWPRSPTSPSAPARSSSSPGARHSSPRRRR